MLSVGPHANVALVTRLRPSECAQLRSERAPFGREGSTTTTTTAPFALQFVLLEVQRPEAHSSHRHLQGQIRTTGLVGDRKVNREICHTPQKYLSHPYTWPLCVVSQNCRRGRTLRTFLSSCHLPCNPHGKKRISSCSEKFVVGANINRYNRDS